MASNTIDEMRQDLQELTSLRAGAKRKRTQTTLDKEMEQLRRELMAAEQKSAQGQGSGDGKVKVATLAQENIINYAWDQSDKFMKLYVTLDNLKSLSDDAITTNFTDRSMTVKVRFPTKICNLHISRLCEEIVAKDSYVKKKSEYVLVMLKKAEVSKTWPYVTEKEKKKKDDSLSTPKMDENEDPSASITKLMKKMYDEGDDEMKRTITKAWSESQQKQMAGM